jgi:hypothetical protein
MMFNLAVGGLIAQNEFSINLDDWQCCYLSENGSKCAAGHLIPDGKYKPEFEGKHAQALFPEEGFVTDVKLLRFLTELQQAHDSAAEASSRVTERWASMMRTYYQIAVNHCLSVVYVDAVSKKYGHNTPDLSEATCNL